MADRHQYLRAIWNRISRQKTIQSHDMDTALRRCLSTAQLILMGIGNTIGVGFYMLIGLVAKEYAGPGVILSFLFAGFAYLMVSVCSAELSAAIPKTGGRFTFVYVNTCEILAFQVGWLLIIDHLVSASVAARVWSGFVDSIFDNAVKNWTVSTFGKIQLGFPFADSLDFLASAHAIFVLIIVSLGLRASARVTVFLTVISEAVLLFVIIMGWFIGDVSRIANADHGGFLPMGFNGVLLGTAACYYTFGGYDIICMSAEEAKTPNTSIPRAILATLAFVTVVYICTSTSLIMIVPYWTIDVRAPLPEAFASRGITWAKYICTVFPAISIANLNILGLYRMTRQVYSMAVEDLLPAAIGEINERTKTPTRAAMLLGILVASATLCFDVANLVTFVVQIDLCCNMIICAIVICNRASDHDMQNSGYALLSKRSSCPQDDPDEFTECDKNKWFSLSSNESSHTGALLQSVREPVDKDHSQRSLMDRVLYKLGSRVLVVLVVVVSAALALQITRGFDDVLKLNWLTIVPLVISSLLLALLTFSLHRMMVPFKHHSFKAPFVPFLPICAIFINLLLLVSSIRLWGLLPIVLLILSGLVFYLTAVLIQTHKFFRRLT